MAEKKWSEDKTMKFIHLYENHEVLWNTSISEYKNKHARQIALEKICKEMAIENFGVNEAKAKINNIRSAYCQEVKKVTASKHSGTGTDSIYKPSVPWFNLIDSFLKSHVIQRPSQTNLIPNVINCTQMSNGNENENKKRENENSENTENTLTQNQLIDSESCTETIETNSPSLNKPMPSTTSTSIRFNKKRKLTPQMLHIDSTVDKLERIAAIASAPKVENAFEVFGKSVAVQLNQLPKRQALASQLKIQTILTEELLKYEESLESNNKQTKIYRETYTPESRQSNYEEGQYHLLSNTSSSIDYNIPSVSSFHTYESSENNIEETEEPIPQTLAELFSSISQ